MILSGKMRLIATAVSASLAAAAAYCPTAGAETYHWTDSQGIMHFSDNPVSVPQSKKVKVQRRDDITTLNPEVRESLEQSRRHQAEFERAERDRTRQRQAAELREAQERRGREAQEQVRRDAQQKQEQKEAQDLKRRLSTAPIQTSAGIVGSGST